MRWVFATIVVSLLLVHVSCGQKQEPVGKAAALAIAIQNDSTVSVADSLVPVGKLADVLKAYGCDSTTTVTIRAPGGVKMGTVDSVRRVLARLGVRRVGFAEARE